MKKIISILLSAAMLFSVNAYANEAAEITESTEGIFEPAPMGTPSDWAVIEIEEAMNKEMIIDSVCVDFQADITREQFCELVMKAFEKLNTEPLLYVNKSFSDTENESVLKAASIGIVNGHGDGIFAPNDKITREQIAAMLVRMLDKANIGLNVNEYKETEFADKAEISDWALPSVNFVYDAGIMQGTALDTIDPQSNTSCEQGIVLVYRTYKKYAYYGKKTIAQSLAEDFEAKATDEATALSIAEELLKNPVILFSPAATEKEDSYLAGFPEAEIKGYKECAMFSPMISTIPFVGYIFTLDNEADTEAFMAELEANAKLDWNICTMADEMVIKSKGNKVFFIMSPYGIE